MKTGTSPIEASHHLPYPPSLRGREWRAGSTSHAPPLDRLISHPVSPAAAVSLSELPAEAGGGGGGGWGVEAGGSTSLSSLPCLFFVCLFPPSLIYLFIFPLPVTSFFLLSPSKVQPPPSPPPHLPCSCSAERVTGCVYI